MCPNNFLMLCALAGVCFLLFYTYKRQIDNARSSGAALEPLLQTPVVRNKFLGINFDLEGYYRDRRVVYAYRMSSERSHSSCSLFMEPKIPLPKQAWFLLDYPKPTSRTRLIKGRIFYAAPAFSLGGGFNSGSLSALTPEEARDILEELAQATSLVEAGQDRQG